MYIRYRYHKLNRRFITDKNVLEVFSESMSTDVSELPDHDSQMTNFVNLFEGMEKYIASTRDKLHKVVKKPQPCNVICSVLCCLKNHHQRGNLGCLDGAGGTRHDNRN